MPLRSLLLLQEHLAGLSDDAVAAIFAPAPGAGTMPMLQQRAAALRELGRGLMAAGGVGALLAAAAGSALGFVEVLVATVPGFDDVRHSEWFHRLGPQSQPQGSTPWYRPYSMVADPQSIGRRRRWRALAIPQAGAAMRVGAPWPGAAVVAFKLH